MATALGGLALDEACASERRPDTAGAVLPCFLYRKFPGKYAGQLQRLVCLTKQHRRRDQLLTVPSFLSSASCEAMQAAWHARKRKIASAVGAPRFNVQSLCTNRSVQQRALVSVPYIGNSASAYRACNREQYTLTSQGVYCMQQHHSQATSRTRTRSLARKVRCNHCSTNASTAHRWTRWDKQSRTRTGTVDMQHGQTDCTGRCAQRPWLPSVLLRTSNSARLCTSDRFKIHTNCIFITTLLHIVSMPRCACCCRVPLNRDHYVIHWPHLALTAATVCAVVSGPIRGAHSSVERPDAMQPTFRRSPSGPFPRCGYRMYDSPDVRVTPHSDSKAAVSSHSVFPFLMGSLLVFLRTLSTCQRGEQVRLDCRQWTLGKEAGVCTPDPDPDRPMDATMQTVLGRSTAPGYSMFAADMRLFKGS
jgi:hypothetical protein